jgi:hypothetical protein
LGTAAATLGLLAVGVGTGWLGVGLTERKSAAGLAHPIKVNKSDNIGK